MLGHRETITTIKDSFLASEPKKATIVTDQKEIQVKVTVNEVDYTILVELFNGKLNVVIYADDIDDPLAITDVTSLPIPSPLGVEEVGEG